MHLLEAVLVVESRPRSTRTAAAVGHLPVAVNTDCAGRRLARTRDGYRGRTRAGVRDMPRGALCRPWVDVHGLAMTGLLCTVPQGQEPRTNDTKAHVTKLDPKLLPLRGEELP